MALPTHVKAAGWGLATVAAITFVILAAPSVSTLMLASFILAYVCAPVVDLLERRGVSRGPGVIMVLVGAGLLLFGMGLLLVPVIVHQAQRIATRLPGVIVYIQSTVVPYLHDGFGLDIPVDAAGIADELRTHLKTIGSKLAAPLSAALRRSFSGAMALAATMANLALVPVVAYYLALDFHTIWPRIEALIPRARVEKVRELVRRIDKALSGFVRGQLTVALILGGIYAVGLSIVGIEGGIVIGLLSGLLNLVPYLGTTLGLGLALTVGVLELAGWSPIIGVLVVYAVGQLLEGFVITPRIVGESVGLSPVAVILAIMAGGEIFGFAGVLLAVPAAAVLKVLLEALHESWLESDVYLEEASGPQDSAEEGPARV